MKERETGTRKPLIFLLVLVSHGLLLAALMHESRIVSITKKDTSEPLLVFFIPRQALSTADSLPKYPVPLLRRRLSPSKVPRAEPPSDLLIPPIDTGTTPKIDWQRELTLAGENATSHSDKETQYRDLSKSMSPAQLNWLTRHHMEPANPGLTWKRPRVEITKDGLPIVHINDHCVLVPLVLIPMVFCSVGHIEPNGDLFDHMNDSQR